MEPQPTLPAEKIPPTSEYRRLVGILFYSVGGTGGEAGVGFGGTGGAGGSGCGGFW